MKYLVCQKQDGEGCGYTIGCGMRYDIIDANSVDDAIEQTIWPDGREEHCNLEGESALIEILVVAVPDVVFVDVDALLGSICEANRKRENNSTEARERAELARLQEKYKEERGVSLSTCPD